MEMNMAAKATMAAGPATTPPQPLAPMPAVVAPVTVLVVTAPPNAEQSEVNETPVLMVEAHTTLPSAAVKPVNAAASETAESPVATPATMSSAVPRVAFKPALPRISTGTWGMLEKRVLRTGLVQDTGFV